MFVKMTDKTKVPVKIWLKDESFIEDECLEQAIQISGVEWRMPARISKFRN